MRISRSLFVSGALLSLFAPGVSPLATEIPVPFAPAEATAELPAIDGIYPVGVRAFYWIDDSRSKSGLGDDDGQRRINATAWYPAIVDEGEKPALYAPGTDKILAAVDEIPENRRRFIRAHEPMLNVAANAVPAAQAARMEGGWPLVLFSPGGNVSLHHQTLLAERLASNGFIFVAMSHPYSSLDVSPDSGLTMSLEWDLDNDDRKIADDNDNRLAGILAGDAEFVLAQLQEQARNVTMPGSLVNFRKVGIAGHSRGGKTVGRACSTNAAFRACAVLDNIGPARERSTGIEQPFLTLRSGWDEARVAELHDYLGRTGSVANDVVLVHSNHFSCTDIPLFVHEVRVDGLDPAASIESCADILAAFFGRFLASPSAPGADWMPASKSQKVTLRQFEARTEN